MATKEDGENASQEGDQRIVDLALQAVYKGTGKGKWGFGKVVRAGNIVVLDETNPHIRNTRDGTVIKLDVNNGVYTMDMWICLDETGPVFSREWKSGTRRRDRIEWC